VAYHEFVISRESIDFASFAYWAQNTIEGETPAERYARAHDAAVANYDYSKYTLGQYESSTPYAIIYRIPVSFNTSVIVSGAPVEHAHLKLYIKYNYSTTDFNIVIQNGQPTYPHNPAVLADYSAAHYSGNGGEYDTADIPSTPVYIEVPLSATGRGWIQKGAGAVTKFCIRSSRDIDAIKPTTDISEYLMSESTYMELRIRVTLSIPTAVTNNYTDKTGSSARFNGEITDSGYWLDDYGFEWKQGLEGEISSITVGSNRATGLEFSYNKTGLSGTIYFRAWGENGAGRGYGEWKVISFDAVTTEPPTQVGVDHAKGNGTATGDNITERGFEIKFEFSGTLYDLIKHHIAGFEGDQDLITPFNVWEATLIKTVTETGIFEAESFVGDLGKWPIATFSDTLFAAKTYEYRAYAIIDGDTYYGEWVEFTTASYPAGEGPDEDAISPTVPIIEPADEEEEILPWEWPDILFPEWEWPPFDIPPFEFDPDITFGRIFGVYMRKIDAKKDWKTLREKCIIYQENMNQFALTINHNMLVLKYLVNDIITYINGDVYPSDLKLMNSSQQLTPLYLEEISPDGFKDIINDFRFRDICNAYELELNFKKILSIRTRVKL